MNDNSSTQVRIVTAASLFDGHDAAINVMRRILQSIGADIIHHDHNRSVHEIVECAIAEDVHGIAITSYQDGHVQFFKCMKRPYKRKRMRPYQNFTTVGRGTILPAQS